MSSPEEIKAEYSSSLADLTFNSKPLINVLTMLADENSPNARVIVEAIEEHLSKVHTEVKLPMLYLIDCIVKNVGGTYTSLFSKNIVTTFIGVFKAVDEKTRAEMFKLRQTWNEVFPQMKLYAIDVQINQLDPAWPVTAKLPSNSIHLNPKFLKPPTNPSQKTKADAEPAPVIPGAPAVDKETLLMQEQLIQKQKELLELQQKRLELEVLQTQVKLQEQIKHSIPKTGRPQNILLKPEVAKQLVPSLAHQKPNEINTSLTQQQKLQQVPVPTTNGTKINPVSSALINAKPIRDPRLMRQQHQKQQQDRAPPTDGNAENQLNQRTALLENNKIVTNKVDVRKVRNDPRLINKNDNLAQKSDSPSKSNMSSKSRSSSDPAHKSHKSSRTSQSSTTSDTNTNKIGPATTLGSPKVNKNSDIVKSKNKRKDDKQSSSNLRNKREKIGSSDDVTIIGTSSTSSVPQSTFKSVKTSTKNRNYVKRNLGSASPEVVQDEDLRSFGPPEKQSRLLGDPIEETSIANTVPVSQPPVGVVQPLKSQLPLKSSDVDLRQLPAAVIGKKRTSTESPESTTAKKNKSEILDKLFGDEDTDLRQLTINTEQRPKTPPPPIISSSESGPKSPTIIDSPKSNLDAIRAKLANATNRDKVLSKSYNKNKLILEDQDLRQPITITAEVANKIIISPEDESNIKSGKMTNEESSKLLNKIILQMEKNKLKEAKRKDNESFNTSLQPISDEEFNDSDFEDDVNQIDNVHEDSPISNENISPAPPIISEESLIPFNDKDERLNAVVPLQPKTDYVPPLFYPRDGREIRRYPGPPGLNWRGGRGNRRNWDPPQPRAPIRPWNNNAWVQPPPPRDFDNENCAAPEEPEPPMLSNGFVNVEEIKSMAIDGISRDIRFYGETAIVFVGWDDPRELTFQNDGIRKIIFNDTESFVLGFNDDYKEVTVNGKVHLVKIGAPSREIFIDSVPYECFFGSPGIRIQLDGLPTKVQLEGPPPPVNIGKTKRTDIVAGKINMVINAKVIVPVFLDAKPQKFVLDGETSTLKFVDALKTVLINDVPFNVEYGGLPKPLLIHDKKHFIRFSVLPKGVKPGKVKILNMEGDSESRASPVIDENSQDDPTVSDAYDPGMPITGLLDKPPSGESPERHSDSPNFYQKFIQQQQNNLDVLSNAMTPTLGPTQATGGYQVENNQNSQDVPASLQPVAPTTIPTLNINDLFQKLVASGFVTSTTSKKPAADIVPLKESTAPSNNDYTPPVSSSQVAPPPIKFKKNSVMNLKRITFERPETLRVRQNNLYSLLYSGMQCSTCGMRFTAEASMLYSQHLDWHFRQNRRGKKNSRVATSRRWYYSLSDWKNYEELEDLEEREKNYFDEQKQAEGAGEDADEDIEIPSVVADPDSTDESCVVCRDKFDQFFNEEKEEWHLKNAIRIDDKTYHPVCYEDYQQSLLEQTMDESIKAPEEKEKAQDEQEETATIPGLEIIIDDDDEDEEEEPVKETQITEIVSVESDESKLVPDTVESTAESSKPENMEEEDDDDDVILNEIAPIKIVVDDDDDEDMDTNAQNASNSNVEDDGFVEIAGLVSLPNGKHVKIKAEPMDKELDGPTTPLLPNDSLSSTAEEADIEIIESTRPNQDVIFSMDGNVEPASGANPVGTSGNRIKINISKPLPVIIKEKESTLDNRVPPETYIDPFEPFPPGEEPEPATLKPALKTVKLKKLPPIRKGTELTGLCSLM